MEKTSTVLLKQDAVIEFLNAEDCKPIDIHAHLFPVFSDNIMDMKRIWIWIMVRRPETVTDKRHQARVNKTICNTTHIKHHEIATQLGISKERIQAIIFKLNYRKLCARWVL